MAAKFNFPVNEESRPPNSKSKSEATGDVDLDLGYDRMMIVASWMLFVRPVPLRNSENPPLPHANHMFLFTDGRVACSRCSSPHLLQACWAARPVLPGAWVVCLARFPAHGKRGCWHTWNASPITIVIAIDVAQPRSPRCGVAVGLAASMRALWLTSLRFGLTLYLDFSPAFPPPPSPIHSFFLNSLGSADL